MFRLLKTIIIILFLSSPVYAENCHDTAVTQLQMNACAKQDLQKANDKLEGLYKSLIFSNQSNKQKILRAKKSWQRYRDEQLNIKFHEKNFGSIYPLCVFIYLKELTDIQIHILEKMLSETVVDDMCAR